MCRGCVQTHPTISKKWGLREADRERYRQKKKAGMELQLLPTSASGGSSVIIGFSGGRKGGRGAFPEAETADSFQPFSWPWSGSASWLCLCPSSARHLLYKERLWGVKDCFCGVRKRKRRNHPTFGPPDPPCLFSACHGSFYLQKNISCFGYLTTLIVVVLAFCLFTSFLSWFLYHATSPFFICWNR